MRMRFIALLLAASLCRVHSVTAQAAKPAAKPKPAVKAAPAAKPKPAPAKPKPAKPAGAKPAPAAPAEPAEPAPPAPPPAPVINTWALLVGVSKYQNPAIPSLQFPAADATAIRDALVDARLGGLPAGNVKLLTDGEATAANISAAVDDFLRPNVKKGDKVIVFLAGHGATKGVGPAAKSYFLATDTKGVTTASLDASAVAVKTLTQKLGELPAAQFTVFMDACRNDPTPGRSAAKPNNLSDIMTRDAQVTPRDATQPASSVTFFACAIGQRAFEDSAKEHGVFTYYILDAIRQGAVPQPDGTVDLGGLASYVKDKVSGWAEQASRGSDTDFEQTPEAVGQVSDEGTAENQVVLLRVKRPISAPAIAATPPRLHVETFPEGAKVTVNGEAKGAGPLTVRLPQAGIYQVKVEAPGYAPLEKSFKVLAGLDRPVYMNLAPGGQSATPTANAASELYGRALEAEKNQQWSLALAGYAETLRAAPTFAPAYERMAALQERQGLLSDALKTRVDMVAQVPTAHGYSALARLAALHAMKQKAAEPPAAPEKKKKGLGGLFGKKDKKEKEPDAAAMGSGFGMPTTTLEAAGLSQRAALQAIRMDPTLAEAQLGLGYALLATDRDGRNKDAALAAMSKAVALDNRDAANHYGTGYALRFFAAPRQAGAAPNSAELRRAVAALQEALKLRPDFFEAHLELALCHHLLGDTKNALSEYQTANSYRGSASSEDDVAGVNVAMAALYQQRAATATGANRQAYLLASQGYMSDAKEITPDGRRIANALIQFGIGGLVRGAISGALGDIFGGTLGGALGGALGDAVGGAIGGAIGGGGGGIRLPF